MEALRLDAYIMRIAGLCATCTKMSCLKRADIKTLEVLHPC
jgi:hypothetical protein